MLFSSSLQTAAALQGAVFSRGIAGEGGAVSRKPALIFGAGFHPHSSWVERWGVLLPAERMVVVLVCSRAAQSACAGVSGRPRRCDLPTPWGDPPPGPCSASRAGHFEAAGLGSGGGRSDSSSRCSGPALRLATGGPGAYLSWVPAQPVPTRRLPLPPGGSCPRPSGHTPSLLPFT